MIKYIKSQIKNIPMILVLTVLCYGIITLADNYLFNSSEVKYDNTSSGVQAGDVQGAIDELYACASNYAAYNTRLSSAETTIGSGSLTTTSQNLIGAVNGLNNLIQSIQITLLNSPSFGGNQSTSGATIYTVPDNYNGILLTLCSNTTYYDNGISDILFIPRGGAAWKTDSTNAKKWYFNSDGKIVGVTLAGDISTHWKIYSIYGIKFST